MIQVYAYEFVQNLTISVFGTSTFLILMHIVVWHVVNYNLGIDIIRTLGKWQMHGHDDVSAKP
jgi:hypothetical protein